MKIVLYGQPLSTQSIYKYTCARGFPNLYMTKAGKDIKEYYNLSAKSQYHHKPLKEDLEIKVKLYFKDKGKKDIDNFNKLLLDSLTGILWQDDCQIKKSITEMLYDKAKPRIEIDVLKHKKI